MEKLLNKCPICGDKLQYSALMQYSLNYQIKRNGKFSKNGRKEDIGSMECGYISCMNPDCDFATDCDFNSINHKDIKIWQQGDKFYYENINDN